MEEKKKKHKWLKKFFIFFGILIFLIIGILSYSRFIATNGLVVKEYRITNSSLSDNFYGLKIVHFSDLHYGTTFQFEDLKKLVQTVNRLKPDLIVFTGDLFDLEIPPTSESMEQLTEELSKMNASIGKYAISGEHDIKFDSWSVVISNSGFSILNDTYDLIYKDNNIPILLSGVSTNLAGGNEIDTKLATTKEYLSSLTEDSIKPSYRILLLHEPDYVEQTDLSYFDLVLAGHSHGGQVQLPGLKPLFLPKGATMYYQDHQMIDTTELFISSGLGTTKIKYRLFNRPSINFYRITNH